MKPHAPPPFPRIQKKKSIRGDSGDSWPVWNRGIITDNISSRAILRHNNIFNRYLPALLYLPSTTAFLRASARELVVPFLHL